MTFPNFRAFAALMAFATVIAIVWMALGAELLALILHLARRL